MKRSIRGRRFPELKAGGIESRLAALVKANGNKPNPDTYKMWRLKYEAAGDEAAAAGDAAVDAAAVRPPSKKRPRQAAAAAAEGGDSSESDDSDSRDLFAVSKGKGRRGSVRKRHANFGE